MAAEKKFENKIKTYLEENGHWYVKYWAGPGYTKSGVPDILSCINGKFYGIEVKAPNGRPSLLQLITLRDIRAAGGVGVLLYPKDFEYFIEYINGSEIGNHWYRENKMRQKEWFDKLNE